jgi:hypothetical protein
VGNVDYARRNPNPSRGGFVWAGSGSCRPVLGGSLIRHISFAIYARISTAIHSASIEVSI